MVDSDYSMNIYKSVKISIGIVMKNPEMLKFLHYHLKTKKMCQHEVKKLRYLSRLKLLILIILQQNLFLNAIRLNKSVIKQFIDGFLYFLLFFYS